MPIINKGILSSRDAYLKQLGNDWPTAQVTTTSDVIERSSNLYFTNVRVLAALVQSNVYVQNLIANDTLFANALILQNINVTSNIISGTVSSGTTTSNIIVADSVTSNTWNRLYTANVIETADNLYFTNARVRSALSNSTGVYYNSSTGTFSIGQDVSQSADVIFKDLSVNGNLYVLGNLVSVFANTLTIADPIIQLGYGNPGDAYDLGWVGHYNTGGTERHTGFFRDRTDGKFKLFDNLTVEPGLTEIDTANVTFRYASIVASTFEGNVTGQVSSLDNFNTNALKEGANLYFTNSRVVSALIAGQNIVIEANGRISANASSGASLNLTTADVRETSNLYFTNTRVVTVVTPFLTTANVIETNANLYFTNTRAISAFTAGKGIIIQENGLIKTATAPAEYNLYIDGSSYGNVLSTMSTMVTMPSATAGDRFIIRSIHITNISDTTDALLSGNILYATGNTAMLINRIPIPVGGVVDLMKRGQLLSPGDKINLQGFTSAGTETSNLLSAMFTYETLATDSSYIGIGQTLATSNTNILIYNSDQAASIIESIKIVNLQDSIIPVKLYWGDANGLVKTHLAHNLPVPSNSSIELLVNPKRIEKTDRLYASYRNAANNSISVFTSARLTATFAIASYDVNVTPGSSPLISIATTEAEGTILYYSIE